MWLKTLRNKSRLSKTASHKSITAKETGDWAEQEAETFLLSQGLKLKKRNYNCSLGEIDLIMSDRDQLVFVEVRFRKNSHFGSPLESINIRKQQKVIRAAQHYLQERKLTEKISGRFDVISVKQPTGGAPDIEWVKNAFS